MKINKRKYDIEKKEISITDKKLRVPAGNLGQRGMPCFPSHELRLQKPDTREEI